MHVSFLNYSISPYFTHLFLIKYSKVIYTITDLINSIKQIGSKKVIIMQKLPVGTQFKI